MAIAWMGATKNRARKKLSMLISPAEFGGSARREESQPLRKTEYPRHIKDLRSMADGRGSRSRCAPSRSWPRGWWPSTEALAPIGVQCGVTANAQNHRVKRRSILPVADMMRLESFARTALLTAKVGADKRGAANLRVKLAAVHLRVLKTQNIRL